MPKTVQKYKVVVHRAEEGGFWAEVPAVEGCFSQGETLEETLENIREALEGCLEAMQLIGQEPSLDVEIHEITV